MNVTVHTNPPIETTIGTAVVEAAYMEPLVEKKGAFEGVTMSLGPPVTPTYMDGRTMSIDATTGVVTAHADFEGDTEVKLRPLPLRLATSSKVGKPENLMLKRASVEELYSWINPAAEAGRGEALCAIVNEIYDRGFSIDCPVEETPSHTEETPSAAVQGDNSALPPEGSGVVAGADDPQPWWVALVESPLWPGGIATELILANRETWRRRQAAEKALESTNLGEVADRMRTVGQEAAKNAADAIIEVVDGHEVFRQAPEEGEQFEVNALKLEPVAIRELWTVLEQVQKDVRSLEVYVYQSDEVPEEIPA